MWKSGIPSDRPIPMQPGDICGCPQNGQLLVQVDNKDEVYAGRVQI